MSSGQTRMTGYRPEVRTSYHTPTMHCGQIVDSQWRPIQFKTGEGVLGIPQGYFDQKLSEHHLLSFPAAEAIRWWFIAAADAERSVGALCLETRLQKYDLVMDHKVTETDAIRAVDYRGKVIEALQAATKEAGDE